MSGKGRRQQLGRALDGFFFVFAGVAAVWLATLDARETFRIGWWGIPFAVAFWALVAYLVLPRLHRILTAIYVPDYFIGRARTSDGLLGDVVNLAADGDEAQLHAAFRAAGWTLADPVDVRSSLGIIRAVVLRRSDEAAPVSPLFLFGRQQDFAYQQQVDGSPGRRHHVRFWRCPEGWALPGGRRVDWVAAASYDARVGLSLFTLQVTHKIAPDTDAERDHVVTALSADPAVAVEVIKGFSVGYHARNGGGDTIRTDGDLPIVDLRAMAAPDAAALDPRAARPVARVRPPASVIAGAMLVLLRVAAATATLFGIAASWSELVARLGHAPGDGSALGSALSLPIVLVAGAIVLAVELGLVVLILVGNDLARIAVMAYAVVTITGAFVAWWAQGQHFTVGMSLVTIALDVLILLALSARGAATYARRARGRHAASAS